MCVNFVSCLSSVKVIGGGFRVIHYYGLNICASPPNSYVETDSKDKMWGSAGSCIASGERD